MDLMEIRRLLLAQKTQSASYEYYSCAIDGSIHTTNITVPARNFTILVEVGALSDGAKTASYFDTDQYVNSSGSRYFKVAFYNNYAYVDIGGRRHTYQVSSGYDGTKVNRFAVSVDANDNYIVYLDIIKATGTASSTLQLTDIGLLRGNAGKNNHGNTITAWLYRTSLSDESLSAFIANGTLPN